MESLLIHKNMLPLLMCWKWRNEVKEGEISKVVFSKKIDACSLNENNMKAMAEDYLVRWLEGWFYK